MRVVVITGLSGSGKTSALQAMEDAGYFCVDNLPVLLLSGLVDLLTSSQDPIRRLSVVMDLRDERFLAEHRRVFEALETRGVRPEVLFLEAPTAVLLRRFEETRRSHPLTGSRTLLEAIELERNRLGPVREIADRVLDTSHFNIHALRRTVHELYAEAGRPGKSLQIELISFGYAKGLPLHADMVLDVRFLPNPHYASDLRDRNGRDPRVAEYIRKDPGGARMLEKLLDWVQELASVYAAMDRAYFVLAVGCTGGRHRSVAVVALLEERLRAKGYRPYVVHRDL